MLGTSEDVKRRKKKTWMTKYKRREGKQDPKSWLYQIKTSVKVRLEKKMIDAGDIS